MADTAVKVVKAPAVVVKPVVLPAKPWPILRALSVLLPLWASLALLSAHLHYKLPTPNTSPYAADGVTPHFDESAALGYINDLALYPDGQPRYRIVGTEEMVMTEKYLLGVLERLKEEVDRTSGMKHEIEIWHQLGDGTHLFDFMDKLVHKKYYSVGNVIVRLSNGTPEGKANAVLVNAHTDSTLPSPGAADDLVGVAVMLEALRVMANSPRELTNSVVFLFNGGEESLQDASHLFITQQPPEIEGTIRSVINLEACGVAGPEIVFQATSEEMIRALQHTPRPYGTVMATEIFATGIILSDTDFRQFEEYGNLTGLDMALVQDSYKYHTQLDVPEEIQPGALQHMGENTLALLEYLTSPETTLGNAMDAKPLPYSQPSALVFFSGLGGHFFAVYTRTQATLAYGVIAALAAVVVSDRVDFSRHLKVYLVALAGVMTSFVGAMVGANALAGVIANVMNKSMAYFRHEHWPILIFAPPALLGITLVQKSVSWLVRTPNATPAVVRAESALIEHATLVGQVVHYSALTLIGHAAGIGSSYLFAMSACAALLALVLNDYLLKRKSAVRELHLATYLVGQASPLLFGVEGLIGFLDLFVPLTGRMGADPPVDIIIASLTVGIGFLALPMTLPLAHRFGPRMTTRIAIALTFVTAFIGGWFSRPTLAIYDHAHPKRILVLHMENTTVSPPVFDLHIASVDGSPFGDLVEQATLGLRASEESPTAIRVQDDTPDWDIIFPVSQFLTTYKVPLPDTLRLQYDSPWADTFTLSTASDQLNPIKRTRALELVLSHPSIMWPVIAFDAHVLEWDLPEPPGDSTLRHHVKSVAGWGVSEFRLKLTLQLSEEQFQAQMRCAQRRKGQRGEEGRARDEQLGALKVEYSGLDRQGMHPASERHYDHLTEHKPGMDFFKVFEKRLPDSVDAMLLSAVAAVAYV